MKRAKKLLTLLVAIAMISAFAIPASTVSALPLTSIDWSTVVSNTTATSVYTVSFPGIAAPYTDKFSVRFDVTPKFSDCDGLVGITDSSTTVETAADLSMIVKLTTGGFFAVRNGASDVVSSVAYTSGTAYNIEIQPNLTAKTYNVWVRTGGPTGGTRTQIGFDYAFNTTAATTDDIGTLALFQNNHSGSNLIDVTKLYGFRMLGTDSVTSGYTGDYQSPAPLSSSVYMEPVTWSIGNQNTGIVYTQFDGTPSGLIDQSVINYGDGDQVIDTYLHNNVFVSYQPDGSLTARNGSSWVPAAGITYTAGMTLHFEFLVNLTTQKWSAWATTPSGVRTQIALDFAFRTGTPAIDDLGKATIWNDTAAGQTKTVANHQVFTKNSTVTTNPTIGTVQVGAGTTTPTGFTAPGAGESIMWESYDTSKATVNALTGAITGVSAGAVTIAYKTYNTTTHAIVADGSAGITVLAAGPTPTPTATPTATPTVTPTATPTIPVSQGVINAVTTYNAILYSVDAPWSGTTYLQGMGYTTVSPVTGRLHIQYDVTPGDNNLDESVAFADSNTLVQNNGDLAMQVRMNSGGLFDVRNGGAYAKLADVAYISASTYHVEIIADMTAKTYSVWVTSASVRTQIASNYAFRAGGNGATADDIGQVFFVKAAAGHSYSVANTMIRPIINGTDAYGNVLYTPIVLPFTTSNFLMGMGMVIEAPKTGTAVSIALDVTPAALGMDTLFGFASSTALVNWNGDLAMLVAFSGGNFVVRNGGSWGSTNTITYAIGVIYHFELVANMTTKTYSVWVTPSDTSVRTQIALDYGFRTGGQGATATDIGQVFFTQENVPDDYTVANFTITGDELPTPTPTATPTITPTPTATPTVTPTATPTATPIAFSDVVAGAWYKPAVDYLSSNGIISGVGGNLFAPEARITRADLLIMFMKAYNIPLDTLITDNFVDAGSRYYTLYLGTAKRLGLVTGTNGYFYPTRTMTRQDMFVRIYRMLFTTGNLPTTYGSNTLANYSDQNQIADYARISMKRFVETGIIVGNNGRLTPLAYATRAQGAQVIYNLLMEMT